jgi:restriction system protein
MTGRDFEEKIALLLESKGYRVHLTPYAGDWGADLVVSRDGRRSVVQLKRWNRSINPKAVQEVVASKAKYGCEHAMIISNREFTRAAGELARVNHVELWGRQRLARELIQRQSAPPAVTSAPVPPAAIPSASDQGTPVASPAASPPRCARCGREMVRRKGKYGEFWGCSGFPTCRNTLPMARQSLA